MFKNGPLANILNHKQGKHEEPLVNAIRFDCHRLKQEFLGFGTHIWGYNRSGESLKKVLEELNIKFIRICRESASWEQLKATHEITHSLDIQWLLVTWKAEPEYCDDENKMLVDVNGFAQWWVDQVKEFDENGMCPAYIELMNEVDSKGGWSTGINVNTYRDLVKEVRRLLDDAGFQKVGIVGPGCTHLDWEASNQKWIDGLDKQAVKSLAAWSSHMWDDGDLGHGGACVVEKQSPCYIHNAMLKDAYKPRFITEYSTKETTFDGVTYPSADGFGEVDDSKTLPYYSVSACIPYAARVYENTLALFNCGVQAPFVWHAMDESSEVYDLKKSWGLCDLDGNPKPVYDALSTLFDKIPVGFRVVHAPTREKETLYAAALKNSDAVVVGISNGTTETATGTILLENTSIENLQVQEAVAFVPDKYGNVDTGTPGKGKIEKKEVELTPTAVGYYQMVVELPANSTLTIVLKQGEEAPKERELIPGIKMPFSK